MEPWALILAALIGAIPTTIAALFGGWYLRRENKELVKAQAAKTTNEASESAADASAKFEQAVDLAYKRLSADYQRIEAKLTKAESDLQGESEARQALAASLDIVKKDLAESQGMLKKETEKRVNVEHEVGLLKGERERYTKQMARLMWGMGQIIEQLKANNIIPVYDPSTDPELK